VKPTAAAVLLFGAPLASAATSPVHYGLFGDLHVVRPADSAARTVLFVSDGNGWDAREDAYADVLAAVGDLVVGIDLPAHRRIPGRLSEEWA